MIKKLGYKIDWKNNVVTMSKQFAREASQHGTPEYEIMRDARNNGFIIAEKRPQRRRKCATRITFGQMRNHIKCLNDVDRRLSELDAVIQLGKSENNQYEYVRKWFFENYPDFGKIPYRDAEGDLVMAGIKLVHQDEKPLKLTA